jgi:alpha-glucosidase
VEFFERVPTVWDTTAVVLGEIGKFIATARRTGDTWFVGGITNNEGRRMEIPLRFLERGRSYLATIYTDGGDSVKTRTRVKIDRHLVESTTSITTDLKSSGGVAIELRPARESDLRQYMKYPGTR